MRKPTNKSIVFVYMPTGQLNYFGFVRVVSAAVAVVAGAGAAVIAAVIVAVVVVCLCIHLLFLFHFLVLLRAPITNCFSHSIPCTQTHTHSVCVEKKKRKKSRRTAIFVNALMHTCTHTLTACTVPEHPSMLLLLVHSHFQLYCMDRIDIRLCVQCADDIQPERCFFPNNNISSKFKSSHDLVLINFCVCLLFCWNLLLYIYIFIDHRFVKCKELFSASICSVWYRILKIVKCVVLLFHFDLWFACKWSRKKKSKLSRSILKRGKKVISQSIRIPMTKKKKHIYLRTRRYNLLKLSHQGLAAIVCCLLTTHFLF